VPDEPLALDFHRTTARVALIMVLSFTEFVHILNDLVEWFDPDDDMNRTGFVGGPIRREDGTHGTSQ
jgi:hypothetical protein